jgi:2-methylcitrate dehydratase PrpD
MTGLQRRIAAFCAAAPAAWPDAGLAAAGDALIDTLAVALAGAAEPAVTKLLAYAAARPGAAPLWFAPARHDAEAAALINGTAAHALDYDDVAAAWRGHPSAVLFAALGAVASLAAARVEAVLRAYVLGYEVGTRLGAWIGPEHYRKGWHATATIGVVAATAACCRLLALPAAQAGSALALAVAQAAGPRANFGTEAKPLHAGLAAAGAVRAALLAQCGLTAAADALAGAHGFAALYGGPGGRPDAFDGLGESAPAIVAAGPEPKLFPACYATHRAIAAALELRQARPVTAAVGRVTVTGSPGSHDALIADPPAAADAARFHMPTVVALALLDGQVTLASFAPPSLARAELRNLAARIDVAEQADGRPGRWARVVLELSGGSRLEARCEEPLSQPGSGAAWRRKVGDCLAAAGIAVDPAGLGDRLRALRGHPFPEVAGGPLSPLWQRPAGGSARPAMPMLHA